MVSTTTEGIWQVSLDPSQNRTLLERESRNVSHVQCDGSRRRTYWVEKYEGITEILEASMINIEEESPRKVFQRRNLGIRYPSEGRQRSKEA